MLVILWMVASITGVEAAVTKNSSSRPRVINYERKLSPRFEKVLRKRTDYIIVHTSEGGLGSTLRTVSRGKCKGGVICSSGGHANYVISRDGDIYRIVPHQYMSAHAGKSMWNGERNLNKISVGIELVGYHYGTITNQQYKSLGWLLKILQRTYKVPDKNVLTHSQIAYSGPNYWFRSSHRGRKRCAKNFERHRAGLRDAWSYDPDVKAGRLDPDPQLASIFYGPGLAAAELAQSNIISKTNTAWSIAGEDYDASDTVYELPNGKTVRGDQFAKLIGWNRMPAGTKVFLNVEEEVESETGPVKTLTEGITAWALAGKEFSKATTKYFLPSGQIISGDRLKDWDNLPVGTRMIMGYRGPFSVHKNRYPLQIAGKEYNGPNTLYYFADYTLKPGSEIKDFDNLPVKTYIFVKIQ